MSRWNYWPISAQCAVPFFEHPIEWLKRRHRWQFAFDVTEKSGAVASLDPELQIDDHGGFVNLLKAALLAALTGGLLALGRRISRAAAG